ncbi:FAD binding domain-containing protein [Pseudonocardia alaniniphila]|uniref:FAD binding domain-containing protein n=1 Tax=Pseudonocardia alaniniphila TaxID=75291 RepID=A0ABS9TAL3_9PSEU|nr:FAD binding domain-containing protein [Pseudonocardia alaniniphila]MCH6165580.1 FAD binding domain-containing protein [Pseudonocardia alaniniphila]
MKPAPFAYVRPTSLDDALAELAGRDAKVLAGGQSLVPVLAMRLGRPATLVDITAVAGLDRISVGSGAVHIGAAVRQRAVERSEHARAVPLLGMALPFVGHRELRSRGTVCGSLAHADPAAELPAVACCLDAVLEIAGPGGRRTVAAGEFFAGAMTTALAPDEVLLAVRFPVAAPGEGYGFGEIARRHGDFALAGVATRVHRGDDGTLLAARLTAFGVSDRPVTRDVTDLVRATDGAEQPLRDAIAELAAELVDTAGDAHGSPGYRRRLLTVLAARELSRPHRTAAPDRPADERPDRTELSPDRAGRPAGAGVAARAQARVEAQELVAVTLRVNGSEVTVRVPPRMHLADALREHLGLTGTHLGCEHGVCGMCTVLVDGTAARACLLFAVQCDGAEVVTVEGLGSADEQHPLQQAFSAHHALQCGFCTPGMLMSSYDLLAGGPVTPEELPGQMSGVLCRCTGYRGILAAVADVAEAHPRGVPEPMNCVARPLVGRGGGAGEGFAAGREPAAPGDGDRREVSAVTDLSVPAGAPTASVEVTSELTAPVDAVWAVLADVERMVACLPGAELTEVLGGDRYRGRAGVALGPVKLSFAGLAQIIDRDPADHRLRMIGQGSDAGGSATQADIRLRAEPGPGGGTVLRADADLYLSGRIAQFGRALAGDVSRRLFEQFARSVDAAATGREAPAARRASSLRLAIGALLAAVRRRITARRRH